MVFSDAVVHMDFDEYSKEITYKISMPENLKPGTRQGELYIIQVGKDIEKNSIVQASLGVVHKLEVQVPFPDQYLQGTIYTQDLEEGKSTTITIGLVNLGQKTLHKVHANILVLDQDEIPVANIETNQISLNAGQKSKLAADWFIDVRPGRYTVQAIILYDDKTYMVKKEIDVGEPLLTIDDFSSNNFKLG